MTNMTREKYEALSVSDLRDIAKKREMKIPSRIKKADLVDLMLAQDEREAKEREKEAAKAAPQAAPAPAQEAPKEGIIRRTVVRKKPVIYRSAEPAQEAPQPQRPPVNYRPAPRPEPPRMSRAAEERERERDYEPQPRYLDGENNYRDRYEEAEERPRRSNRPEQPSRRNDVNINAELDSGITVTGILEVMNDGFGFIRSDNYMPGDADVYVAPSQIRKFRLKTGDIVTGNTRTRTSAEKFSALLYVTSVNGEAPNDATPRVNFEDLTPIFPNEKIRLERQGGSLAMRVMDLMCPVGKGQRGMIVSPPKAGKTTLLKQVASSVLVNNPEIHLIILLIDERPEEVTDIKEAIQGPNVEVIYSTFDELPEHHKRVSEMVIERAKRLVEQKRDVMILIDSITRLTRAYNITEESSGRTLSGGLDPAALHMPKRFFGAARNMREGGSLTILATALIETGSKMDDVVYEEFKGTGNMELILNRKLSERRIFPAVDLAKSGTRRDDLLLTPKEQEAAAIIHRMFIGQRAEDATDTVLDLFAKTRNNAEFVEQIRRMNAMKWRY
ncbi:MAG: transcription termination factor Rho [Lachnospiraceae bacterium]|jgi:transcription termination factor Rho|nr:transcription termination factor Rho [Lachnospiraceae bacterium]MCI1398179.1 transcription termination factor Rho [Lachnospiraceae bacterium]MCI1424335.1 transcription termination factor Rho [Lachnospiraceae bacterium]MCI1453099.1 transcription termination factor Rho [Lachnospiraceae bacterium]MDD5849789.1 transcription termination factor Rho [Bacillota bacterium]